MSHELSPPLTQHSDRTRQWVFNRNRRGPVGLPVFRHWLAAVSLLVAILASGATALADDSPLSEIRALIRRAREEVSEVREHRSREQSRDDLIDLADELHAASRKHSGNRELRDFCLAVRLLEAEVESLAGRHERALGAATLAVRAFPLSDTARDRLAETHWAFGNHLHEERNFDAAIDRHRKALELFPRPRFQVTLGIDLAVKSLEPGVDSEALIEEAHRQIDQAIWTDSETREWRLIKAQVLEIHARLLLDHQQPEAALDMVQRALVFFPTLRTLYRTRMECHLQMARFPQAVRDGETALKLAPYDPELLRMIADARLQWAEHLLAAPHLSGHGKTAPEPGEFAPAFQLLDTADQEYQSLKNPLDLNERLYAVRAFAHRRRAEAAGTPDTPEAALTQMQAYADCVADVRRALVLEPKHEFAASVGRTRVASQLYVTRVTAQVPDLKSTPQSQPVFRSVLPATPAKPQKLFHTTAYEAFLIDIPGQLEGLDIFVRIDNVHAHAQVVRQQNDTGSGIPEEFPSLDAAGNPLGDDSVVIEPMLLESDFGVRRTSRNDPQREIKYLLSLNPASLMKAGNRKIWLVKGGPAKTVRFWLVVKRQTEPVTFRPVVRVIPWNDVLHRAFDRLDELVKALREEQNRLFGMQLLRAGTKSFAEWLSLVVEDDGLKKFFNGVSVAIGQAEEASDDLNSGDPERIRRAVGKISLKAVTAGRYESEWLDEGQLAECVSRRRQLEKKKESSGTLSQEEAEELAMLNQKVFIMQSAGGLESGLNNLLEEFDADMPTEQQRQELIRLQKQVESGELREALLTRYVMEELLYTVLSQ